MRIAAFGFRSLPSTHGSAGADKFVEELLPRLVERGHEVVAYNRKYRNVSLQADEYKGVKIRTFSTVSKKGFDTLLHSLKCTFDIIVHDTADIVHIQNGGNSVWALFLRLFGKKVFLSQDGVDWKRNKWSWYAKMYLRFSSYLSSRLPNTIIFDNVIAKSYFEKKFNREYEFIPFGSEVSLVTDDRAVLERYGLAEGGYYLFVGRFIPDKGLQYLLPAFLKANTGKKLVLVGGSPNPSAFEVKLKQMGNDPSVVFTGFLYGDDVQRLMRYSFCYIQPSDVEGLSPVVLTVMGLGVPLIVSDIPENMYAVQDTAVTFKKGSIPGLRAAIQQAESDPSKMKSLAVKARNRALKEFNWETVTDRHVDIFTRYMH